MGDYTLLIKHTQIDIQALIRSDFIRLYGLLGKLYSSKLKVIVLTGDPQHAAAGYSYNFTSFVLRSKIVSGIILV